MRPFPKVLVATALLVGSVVGPPSAWAEPSVEQVRRLLSAYEHTPGERAFRALGPDTLEVLIQLHDDPRQPTYVRLRALAAAAHFPTPRTRSFLVRVARKPDQHELFVREAVMALQEAFGGDALEEVSGFLQHRRPLVRRAAATCLSRMERDVSEPHLRRHLGWEHDPMVRRAVQRLLRGLKDRSD